MNLPDIALIVSAFGVAIRAIAVAIVPANRRPSSATAWLLAIFFIPTLGVLAYALLGSSRLPKERREKQREINELVRERTREIHAAWTPGRFPSSIDAIVGLNRNLGAMPMLSDNRAEVLADFGASLDAMTAAVDASREVCVAVTARHVRVVRRLTACPA